MEVEGLPEIHQVYYNMSKASCVAVFVCLLDPLKQEDRSVSIFHYSSVNMLCGRVNSLSCNK